MEFGCNAILALANVTTPISGPTGQTGMSHKATEFSNRRRIITDKKSAAECDRAWIFLNA